MSTDKIIIGIDFGTTYSAIGWMYSGIFDVLCKYPGNNNKTSDKVPTAVLYPDDPSGQLDWGWEANGDPRARKYFKLELDPQQRDGIRDLYEIEQISGPLNGLDFRHSRAERPSNSVLVSELQDAQYSSKKAEEVCVDFLKALRTEAMAEIERQAPGLLKSATKEYVLTIPAIWSNTAKQITKECAVEAGFGPLSNIRLLDEPEAAAIHAIKTLSYLYTPRAGENFIVCDAGGGTVDLITYRVKKVNPLVLEESVPGSGDTCGSMCLNWRFEAFVASKLGHYYTDDLGAGHERAKNNMSKIFEEVIKVHFQNDKRKRWPIQRQDVPLPVEIVHTLTFSLVPRKVPPDQPEKGIEEGELNATNDDILRIFDPVIDRIIDLIEEQNQRLWDIEPQAQVAAILLVGGFGGNQYLKQRVEGHFAGRFAPGFKVLQPHDAWSSVVRGAVMWGAENRPVTQRKARASYGIEYLVKWEDHYPQKRAVRNHYSGTIQCSKMRWWVRAGDTFDQEKPLTLELTASFDVDSKNPRFKSTLYMWKPPRLGDREPTFQTEDCHPVGVLDIGLNSVRDRWIPKTAVDGRSFYSVVFEVRLEFGTEIVFSFRADDKTKQRISIQYDKQTTANRTIPQRVGRTARY